MTWKPAKDKPNTIRDVLICLEMNIDGKIGYTYMIGFYGRTWISEDDEIETENAKVFAWMEIPQIPFWIKDGE